MCRTEKFYYYGLVHGPVISHEGCGLCLCVSEKRRNLCSSSLFDFRMTIKCTAILGLKLCCSLAVVSVLFVTCILRLPLQELLQSCFIMLPLSRHSVTMLQARKLASVHGLIVICQNQFNYATSHKSCDRHKFYCNMRCNFGICKNYSDWLCFWLHQLGVEKPWYWWRCH